MKNHRLLTFIELWDQVDTALLVGSESDDDDICSLKSLRDQVLREARLTGDGSQLSHSKLISILMRVKEAAINKSTWEEAINSAGGASASPSRMHSLCALSKAIKVMLEEYLKAMHVLDKCESLEAKELDSADSPPVDLVESERIDSLLREIDLLKDKLTESECKMSRLKEEKDSLEEEIYTVRAKYLKVEASLVTSDGLAAQLEAKCKSLEVDLALQKERNSVDIPKAEEWEAAQRRIDLLESVQSQLQSQVHTLEVQKADAEAEITRLRNDQEGQKPLSAVSTRPPSVVSSLSRTRFDGKSTVSVFGREDSLQFLTNRSSGAEAFVHPKRRFPRINNHTSHQCVQQ